MTSLIAGNRKRSGQAVWVSIVVMVIITLVIIYLMFSAGIPFIIKIVQNAFGGS